MKRKVLPCFMALSMTLTAVPNVAMAEDGSMNEAGTVVETTTETGTTTGTEPAEEPAGEVGASEVVDTAEGTPVNNGATGGTVVEATEIQPAMVMATEEVAAENGVEEVADAGALKFAVENAPNGVETTIQLTDDIVVSEAMTVEKGQNIILDMAKHEITVKDSFKGRIFTNNGTLTIKGNGKIDVKKAGKNGYGAVNNFGTLTVVDGTYVGLKDSDASIFYNRNGGTATFENPTIDGGGGAVATEVNTTTEIHGGSYSNETYPAIENRGNMLITGGTFKNTSCSSCDRRWGYTIRSGNGSDSAYLKIQGEAENSVEVTGVQGGLAVVGGTADIYNGSYETILCETHGGDKAFYAGYFTGESYKTSTNIYGGTFRSASKNALQIGNGNPAPDSGAGKESTVMISGGTFIGGDAAKTAIFVENEKNAIGGANITGGTFSSDVGEFVDPSSDIEKDESGNWVTKPIPVEDAVASVGDRNYKTLADAVEAVVTSADKTGTVVLQKDATGSGIGLFNGKGHTGVNLTIDFGGYTYTCGDPAVGSSGTESQGFHLEKGNTVVLKNGKIAVADSSQKTIMLIQNYCDLTLEDLTLEGSAITQYIISSNYGDVVLNRVNISGAYSDLSNLVALDVMHWHGTDYEGKAPTLEVHNTSANTIQGKMDVYCYDEATHNVVQGCEDQPELTLYGGSYTDTADPREYLAPGYVVKENGGKFTVSKKSSGGSHRYDGYITVINPKNGTVSVSDDWADEDQKITLTITPDKGYVVDKIEIVDLEGDKITAKKVEDKDDKYTFRMANCDVTVTVTFKEEGKTEDKEETTTEETETEETTKPETITFSDVKESDWFYKGVSYAVENGMMNGVGDDQFAPNAPLTREMLAVVLYNMEKQPESTGVNPFADVKADMWYTDAIVWANANGIVAGYDDSTFGLGDSITREQLATILYRYAQLKDYDVTEKADLTGYTDSTAISGYAVEAMQWANANGIVNGMTETTLAPQGTATRAQVATMLMNFYENVATKAE